MRYIVATLPTFRLQRLGYHDHCAAILLSGRGGVVLAMTAWKLTAFMFFLIPGLALRIVAASLGVA